LFICVAVARGTFCLLHSMTRCFQSPPEDIFLTTNTFSELDVIYNAMLYTVAYFTSFACLSLRHFDLKFISVVAVSFSKYEIGIYLLCVYACLTRCPWSSVVICRCSLCISGYMITCYINWRLLTCLHNQHSTEMTI